MAARACAHGLPGWRILESEDPIEVALITIMTTKTEEYKEQVRQAQAVAIVNALAASIKGRG